MLKSIIFILRSNWLTVKDLKITVNFKEQLFHFTSQSKNFSLLYWLSFKKHKNILTWPPSDKKVWLDFIHCLTVLLCYKLYLSPLLLSCTEEIIAITLRLHPDLNVSMRKSAQGRKRYQTWEKEENAYFGDFISYWCREITKWKLLGILIKFLLFCEL